MGLRAGLSGIEYLGKDYFELREKVEITLHRLFHASWTAFDFPQAGTAGKFDLEVKASNDVSVEFVRCKRRISIMVKIKVLEAFRSPVKNSS
ncbi:MAG: hypothetical protein ACLQO7_07965 [Candidatus Bathyarchaeia archaeon]